ncbi:DUF6457 domain-containing protein [Dactylosporangium sp. NPDC005555]|uniref:DUF6457 domain-containing protein n=1 Tax=Dactylosporangium sp. NPDC005555 TaxID=3154889 RepID=UPI0033BD8365
MTTEPAAGAATAGDSEWLTELASALDITDVSPADRIALLKVARQVAHGVCRPAAPLTTYLLGVAVGRGADVQTAATAASRLVAGRPSSTGAEPGR